MVDLMDKFSNQISLVERWYTSIEKSIKLGGIRHFLAIFFVKCLMEIYRLSNSADFFYVPTKYIKQVDALKIHN